MSTYITGPFYGNYDQFKALLDKINFKKDDYLFILGNAIGDSSGSMDLIRDLNYRENIVLVLGSQEYYARTLLPKIPVDADDVNEAYQMLSGDDKELFGQWIKEGGYNFVASYMTLEEEEKEDILDFLEDLEPYDYYEDKDLKMKLALTYAMPVEFSEEVGLSGYDAKDFVLGTVDYTKQYFSDKTYLFSACVETDKLGVPYGKIYAGKKFHLSVATLGRDGGRACAFAVETRAVKYAPFTEHLDI